MVSQLWQENYHREGTWRKGNGLFLLTNLVNAAESVNSDLRIQ